MACLLYPIGYNNGMKTIEQTEEFRQWLNGLRDRTAKAIIVDRIQRVARGLPGDIQPTQGPVSELRIHHGPGYRVYLTQRGNALVILLCGGDKGSQKRDIAKAIKLEAGL